MSLGRRHRRCAGVALGATAAVLACHPAPGANPDAGALPGAPVVVIAEAAPPARCARLENAGSKATLCDQTELGVAIPLDDSGEIAVGATGDQGKARIVRFGKDPPVSTTLGEACDGSDPPRPFMSHTRLLALSCVKRTTPAVAKGADALAPLTLFGIAGANAERLVDIPASAESFDIIGGPEGDGAVGGLLVWGDAAGESADSAGIAPTSPSGGLKMVTLSADLRVIHALRPLPGSAGGIDPRLALRARGSGFWLAWLQTRREHGDTSRKGELEGPSDEGAFAWVELALLDSKGQPVGAVRRVTSTTGRLRGYDLWPHGEGLDVLVEDESGSISRVGVHQDGSVGPSLLVTTGAFPRLPPRVIPASPALAWLTFVDTGGDDRLLPLASTSAAGLPNGGPPATLEPALAGASILGILPSRGGQGPAPSRFALAGMSEPPMSDPPCPWSLRWAACAP